MITTSLKDHSGSFIGSLLAVLYPQHAIVFYCIQHLLLSQLLLHFCCWKNRRRMQCNHYRCPYFAGLVSDAFHLTFGCGLLTFSLFAMAASRTKPDNLYTYGSVLIPCQLLYHSFFLPTHLLLLCNLTTVFMIPSFLKKKLLQVTIQQGPHLFWFCPQPNNHLILNGWPLALKLVCFQALVLFICALILAHCYMLSFRYRRLEVLAAFTNAVSFQTIHLTSTCACGCTKVPHMITSSPTFKFTFLI